MKAAQEAYGSIDILINNAAGNFLCRAEKLSYNGWRAVVDIV
jgi:NAD(P)-dependent dehydrogenase (short-subunit alcohol dehydrogenase family)